MGNIGNLCGICNSSFPESELKNQTPIILGFFEIGNEEQKNYLKELVTKFKLRIPLKFDINSTGNDPFCVKLRIGEELFDIQDTFDNDNIDEDMEKAVNKCKEIFSEKGMI